MQKNKDNGDDDDFSVGKKFIYLPTQPGEMADKSPEKDAKKQAEENYDSTDEDDLPPPPKIRRTHGFYVRMPPKINLAMWSLGPQQEKVAAFSSSCQTTGEQEEPTTCQEVFGIEDEDKYPTSHYSSWFLQAQSQTSFCV